MSRSAIVVNPAKVEDLDGRRREICDELARAGWPEPMWLETTESDPGRGQARRAVDAGAEVVFVCGGDGTVLAVLNELAGTDVALCVLPSGTGNLLARNLSVPSDVADGVRLATGGVRRRIDVGRAAVDGDDHMHFAVMAGLGFDARMLAGADDRTKARWGWAAYVVSALRHLRDEPFDVTLRLDDGEPLRRRVQTVLVGNVGRLQGGVVLLPDAVPDDGWLDVAVLTPRGLRQWLTAAARLLLRRKPKAPLETFRARRIEVTAEQPQPREVDGDAIEPAARLSVQVVPAALTVCVADAGGTGRLEEAA